MLLLAFYAYLAPQASHLPREPADFPPYGLRKLRPMVSGRISESACLESCRAMTQALVVLLQCLGHPMSPQGNFLPFQAPHTRWGSVWPSPSFCPYSLLSLLSCSMTPPQPYFLLSVLRYPLLLQPQWLKGWLQVLGPSLISSGTCALSEYLQLLPSVAYRLQQGWSHHLAIN